MREEGKEMNFVLCAILGFLVGFIAGCVFKVVTYGDLERPPSSYWSEGYDDGYADGYTDGKHASPRSGEDK